MIQLLIKCSIDKVWKNEIYFEPTSVYSGPLLKSFQLKYFRLWGLCLIAHFLYVVNFLNIVNRQFYLKKKYFFLHCQKSCFVAFIHEWNKWKYLQFNFSSQNLSLDINNYTYVYEVENPWFEPSGILRSGSSL